MFGFSVRSIVLLFLWLGFVVVLGAVGSLALKACGVRILGVELSWCRAADLSGLQKLNILQQQIHSLEQQKAEPLICGPASSMLPIGPLSIAPQPSQGTIKRAELAPSPSGNGIAVPSASLGDMEGAGELAPGMVPPPGAAPTPGANPLPGASAPAAVAPPPGTASSSNPDGCPANKGNNPYIVLALDHSKSMGLPTDIDDVLATKLEIQMSKPGPGSREASRAYNSFVEQPGRKRLDVLKDSVAEVSQRIDENIDIGVVTFAGCGGVVDLGDYANARRKRMVQKVQRLQPEPATPAADALKTAIQKASRVPGGRVILVSDGNDTCDGDPCAVARNSQGVQVDVISMGGGDVLSCVAQATNGKLIKPNAEQSVEEILAALGQTKTEQTCQ